MRFSWIPCLLFLISQGCHSLTSFAPNIKTSSSTVLMLPEFHQGAFQLRQKVVFSFRNKTLSTLQDLTYNPETSELHAVFISPLGLKLFEFVLKKENLISSFVCPAFQGFNPNDRFIKGLATAFALIYQLDGPYISLNHGTFKPQDPFFSGEVRFQRGQNPHSLEKKYFMGRKNVITIQYLEWDPAGVSTKHPLPVEYIHHQSGMSFSIKQSNNT